MSALAPSSLKQSVMSRLPSTVRRPIETLFTLRNMGLFSNLDQLADQVRHREDYTRFERGMRNHFVMATVLRAHKLSAFDKIDNGVTPQLLATQCNIQVNAAHALLRILEGEGYVEHKDDLYVLTRFARLFLTHNGACTLAPMLDLMAAQAAAFNGILEGMTTSDVPHELDISTADSNYVAYINAVNAYLHRAGADLVRKAQLPNITSIIAGSMGVSMVAHLLHHFPQARVTYGCLPHLVTAIPDLCQDYGVDTGRIDDMHGHGGNPEEDQWGCQSFDCVFLTKKMILEPQEQLGERFAQKAFQVLRPGGVAIFWETLYPDQGALERSSMLEAVLNMGASPAAPVRTESGFTELLRDMGYVNIQIVPCLFGQTTFIVATRP